MSGTVIQVPHPARDFVFNPVSAELYLSGNFPSIHSLDLEEGRFKNSTPLGPINGTQSLAFSSATGLLCAVGGDSFCFIDPRSSEIIKRQTMSDDSLRLSSLSDTGINFSLASDSGQIAEYDMRAAEPLHSEMLDGPIKSLCYKGKHRVCATNSNIHIYSKDWIHTPIKVDFQINTFAVDGNVVLVGGEAEHIQSYIVDGLGMAPSWCSHIALQ